MAFNLPQDILTELRKRIESKPDTLSVMETAIAQRVRECERCAHLWIHRTRREPRRCPKCGTTAWNFPLIDLIRKAQNKQTPENGGTLA
jgi:rubrerythrin